MQCSASTTPISSPLHTNSSTSTTLNSRVDPVDPFSEAHHLSPPCPITPQRMVRQVENNNDLNELIKLETMLKCSVCKDFYDLPMSSKCQHTFCAGCAEFEYENKSTGLRCPICKYSFTNFAQFYKNNLICDIIREYKNNRDLITRLYARGKAEERERCEGSKKKVSFKLSNNDSTTTPPPFGETKKLINTNDNDSNEQNLKRKRDDNESPFSIKSARTLSNPSKKPKVAYGLMNERILKNLLKEEGLITQGSKTEMMARHSYFINLYNSNVDATNPKNKGELLREMRKWERARNSDEARNANMIKKTLTSMEQVDSYANKYRNQFDELIQQAKGTKGTIGTNRKRKEMA